MAADDLPVPDASMRAYDRAVMDEHTAAVMEMQPATSGPDNVREIAAPVVAAELRTTADALVRLAADPTWTSPEHNAIRADALEEAARFLRARADSLHPAEETTR